ncbi:ABC transporter ATP-binding protein [Schleiferilactobacillus harbinensis]|uniref:ATP-binding cassette domain-containing protein n=1 Tax=Schleiferilactobacillus harbinensis TaxID=304207 RepID=UPI001AAF2323|nr:ABC transporter ATP-binding protein [Schleiferilactobacillus harbinensis]MBO3092715.1 ABC transporter ATP-binding protein [Schleiferilactobacillus harbinensis]
MTLIPNQLYALVGPSGAGKSTLMAVLERFYTPTSGTLQVGDTPAACFALTAWRQHLAYVPQTSEVLSGTYRAYLQLAAPQASDADLNQALAAVQLTDFIASLPAGLDSQIAEAGTNMSGGQKQRLTIAQALLKKADIYLFDEITANLDADSEAIIRDLIRQLAATHTVLAAAHRLSSVRDADQVIVLENGRITGQGTPAELLTRNTTYARFVQEQSLA